MNKSEIDYLTSRIEETVRQSKKEITTRLYKDLKEPVDYTTEEKYKMIRQGKAKLKPISELAEKSCYHSSQLSAIFAMYEFTSTAVQKKNAADNAKILVKVRKLHKAVEAAGKLLADTVILKTIDGADIAAGLAKIAAMA